MTALALLSLAGCGLLCWLLAWYSRWLQAAERRAAEAEKEARRLRRWLEAVHADREALAAVVLPLLTQPITLIPNPERTND